MLRDQKTPIQDGEKGLSLFDASLLGVATFSTLILVATMSITAAALLGGGVLLFALYQLIIRP